MNTMTQSSIEAELSTLKSLLLEMGGQAESQLSRGIMAFKTRNLELADAVIADDLKLDALEEEVDQLATSILMLRQPMARELRRVIATVKIASTIERIGDLAKNISRRSKTLSHQEPLGIVTPIASFGLEVQRLVAEALDAYTHADARLATQTREKDAHLDDIYHALVRDIVDKLSENPQETGGYTHMLFIAKNLERIGDHATFIAEMAYFVATGQYYKEERPKGEADGGLITGDDG